MEPLGPFERAPALAVAVSGGADSLALAILAAAWAERRGGRVLALTVDHGLRPESAAEARQTAAWLAARGITSRVLAWEGPKPAAGIQAAARAARYALLEAASREAGLLHLLLAHHALDQAETTLIRAERGSGATGLAGMAAVRERPGLRLLRPLLGVMPDRLRATLRELGQPWLEDPSNRSPRFRRGRLRAEADIDAGRWLAVAREAASARAAADRELAAFAAAAVSPDPLGFLTVALDRWRALPREAGELALARCLQAVAGRPYPPSPDAVARLAGRLAAADPVRATLGGTLVLSRGGHILVMREPARIADERPLAPGERAWWDGRFEVAYRDGPGPALLRPLAAGRLRLLPAVREALGARRVPAAALEALPALWRRDEPIACPLPLVEAGGRRVRAGFTFRPAQPLAGAPFGGDNVV